MAVPHLTTSQEDSVSGYVALDVRHPRAEGTMGFTKLGLTQRDSMGGQRRRRGWDRRRDLGRRIIRDRRREAIPVATDHRSGRERRSGNARRCDVERRSAEAKRSGALPR